MKLILPANKRERNKEKIRVEKSIYSISLFIYLNIIILYLYILYPHARGVILYIANNQEKYIYI